MVTAKTKRRFRHIVLILLSILLLFIAAVVVAANMYVEPVLRKRLHTLIVEGSDSLYNYHLGSLDADFFGGNAEVSNLQILVDSNRYYQLKKQNTLPPLVMQLDMSHAHIRGLSIFSLLFGKKIKIDEIFSKEADIRLIRYAKNKDTATVKDKQPLWKAIQPKIKDIVVHQIRLEGIKLLYKNAEASDAKLQFDRCDALFKNIRIDSAVVQDTSRLGYIENFSFKLNDLKFRTSDSTYKMKAEWITYNSAQRLLQIDSFKLQPTLKEDERNDTLRKSWYTIMLDKVSFLGLRLDRYLRLDRAEADSVVFQNLVLSIFQDRKGLKNYASKIGHYPHQLLMKVGAVIDIKKIITRKMQVQFTERHETTREEATIQLNDINLTVDNIVNDSVLIKKNAVSTAQAEGKIIGSPIKALFRFYLDSAEGRFDMSGHIGSVTAAQINPIAMALSNIVVPSVQITSIDFFVKGEDFNATASVQMLYNNLSLVLRKRNEETGTNSTRKFLTKILNRFALYSSNPNSGTIRKAEGVKVARLTTQSFFGIIWKAVFAGMQRIMLKSGQVG